MKATSLPNLNHEATSYHNFFSFIQDPNHHDDTTLHKRPNIDHSQVSEPSETSPFKAILSPFVLFNGSNENHYPVGGYFDEWDQNQMDQTLPRLPPIPTRSSDTTVSVGSNPFSGNVGARSEGPNVTQLQGDQTLPSMSSVGSKKTIETWTKTTPDLIDDGYAWKKYGQKDILGAMYPRSYFRCAYRQDQCCWATKQVQKTDEDPPMYQITYRGNHTCRDPPKAPHIILDSTVPNDASNSNFISFGPTHYPLPINQSTPIQLSDSMVFESSGAKPALSSGPSGSDHSDTIYSSGAHSCTPSAHDNSFDGLDFTFFKTDMDQNELIGLYNF